MSVDGGTVTILIIGVLILGALAVVLDRVNFPQKPFRPKRIETGVDGPARDRTGAHILDDADAADDGDSGDPAEADAGEDTGGPGAGW